MRVGIDARPLMAQAGGIGRYAANLVRSLLNIPSNNTPACEFVLFTGPQTSRDYLSDLVGSYEEYACALKSSLLRSLFSLPRGIVRQQIDVFHGLDQTGIPWLGRRAQHVVTLHDVMPLLLPHLFTAKHSLVVRATLARVARQAALVIVPSYAVQHDVLQHLRLSEERVLVIPEGCEAHFTPQGESGQQQRVREKYRLPAYYILSLGTLEPRKNVTTLLRAFAHLRCTRRVDPTLQLVIAGPRGWGETAITREVQRLGLAQAVRLPGFIEEEDLPTVYRGATLFVFPSLYEGFGLPILEAMGCGVPVITSNVSSLPEVAGDAAILVDPLAVENMAATMEALIYNQVLREELRQKGFKRVQAYSWEVTAQKTLAVYRHLGER